MSNKKELNKVDINVQFEESPTRINITSGEGIKTLFGKIRKYFSDLHSVAFSGSYEDLENKPTIPEIPDVSTKMDKDNPVGTGSLSIDRKSSTTIGKNSVALGKDCIAAGDYSLSMGYQNTVNAHYASGEGQSNTIGSYGYCSHVEGWSNTVTGRNSHAEGYGNKASNSYTHAEGNQVIASGESAHAEGYKTTASGEAAHVEGRYSKAQKISTHAEGCFTIADSPDQHTEGRYNKIDSESIYAHIVGNGTNDSNRSNAYTLDWDGNGVYSGKVSVGANVTPTEDNDLVTKKYVDDNSTIKAVDCTRAEYDAMEYHDPDTYYNIIDEDNGLATHEADGLMSKEDKIKLDGMSSSGDNTINGIPVDLKGIYNTQVIGYDEEQGKLVPMISVARTETVLPNTEIPVPWEWDLVNVPPWMGVSETSTNQPYITNTSTAPTTKDDIIFSIKSTKSYLISEYTSAVLNLSIAYIKLNTSTFELSKDADFNTIDASFSVSFGTNITANISNLTGKYYWRYNFSGQSLGTAYSSGSMFLRFNQLKFSQGGTT